MVDAFRSRDGTQLSYRVEGVGPPLLLHLGAGCDSGLWKAAGYLDALTPSNTCVLFDHRGHGTSDHPRDAGAYHIDRFVDDVVALLEHLELERVAFWGYSNAVAVGLKLADEHPSCVECLIASGGLVSPPRSREVLEAAVARSIEGYRTTGWQQLLDGFKEDEGPIPQWMRDRIVATDVEPVISWSQSRLDWTWSAWDALSRVHAPMLFVMGELEDPEDEMSKVVALMANGRRSRISGKGHINAYLDSNSVLPIVKAFLDEVRASS